MLNGKQKRYLRSLAMKQRATMQVGKAGITEAVIKQLQNEIEKNELLKISLLQNTVVEPAEVQVEIQATDATIEFVQKIGRNMVFYKRATEPKNRNISAHVGKLK
ncbi:hypothetical protein FC62_GL001379 [Amylolactobacillus amylotrophicus DSM 20534]|uniref:Uncharacterized protein n=3 Tax=Amylolactobacillus TaxID=2767876 RepID=A0A0R1YHQ8_9LACO|nr:MULTISPECIES: YhbY family RNA-binding protein [Amylolactobacillus]APT17982.1 hypothetical protein LA20533_00990 [Amylolactobacillus amylophilus DSM 20533 = JCM 1125]KRK37264.1 hypothetical protein FC62_GL001379 [Amylolactobacillus amylotrophicus DSM 20534]KRM41663.1 hypothetical protein FD40_GL001225 [Amylolactobacillus amylophilus DSM 20533 = JCM 1125]GED80738.1 RNA-binding protein [Amylolactobacillus amylophilus]